MFGVGWDGGSVAYAVQGRPRRHWAESAGDCHGDGEDSRAILPGQITTRRCGTALPVHVLRGLEDLGLEDLNRGNAIIAATDRYIESQAVFKQMKTCADRSPGENVSVFCDVAFSMYLTRLLPQM